MNAGEKGERRPGEKGDEPRASKHAHLNHLPDSELEQGGICVSSPRNALLTSEAKSSTMESHLDLEELTRPSA